VSKGPLGLVQGLWVILIMTTALCAKGPFGTCPREIFLSQTSPLTGFKRGTTLDYFNYGPTFTEVFSGKPQKYYRRITEGLL
jgi:hypothetical protein